MTSWWNSTIPLWQLMLLVLVYVLYKELIKLTLKTTVRTIRRRRNARNQLQTAVKPILQEVEIMKVRIICQRGIDPIIFEADNNSSLTIIEMTMTWYSGDRVSIYVDQSLEFHGIADTGRNSKCGQWLAEMVGGR